MPADQFPRTSWSLIARIVDEPLTPGSRQALATLCEGYWFPVYAFIRRRGGSAELARDRTQGFFAYLLEKKILETVDPTLGRKFRSWLLGCVKHYLAREHDRASASRRAPAQPLERLDEAAEERFHVETAHHLTPERLYDRHFARSLLARVLELLRARYAAAGKAARFEALQGCVSQEAAQRPYEEVAADLGIGVDAAKKAAFDLRDRYKKLLRAEVACLVQDPDNADEVDGELRDLLAALED